MDIWQKMYEQAQALYQPQEVSDFVYAKHVVAAVEAEDGQIFTGFFMVDYETRQTITLGELLPLWWGEERAQHFEEK